MALIVASSARRPRAPLLAVFLVGVASLLVDHSRAELFTAITHLRGLQNTEAQVAGNVAHYLRAEQERLDFCQEMLGYMHSLLGPDEDEGEYEYDEEYDDDDYDDYTWEDVLRSYLTRIWLAYNWPELTSDQAEQNYANAQLLQAPNARGCRCGPTWPNEEDLSGAAVGLCRLQHTYGLSTQQMVELKSPLLKVSAHDRREVAQRCFDSDDVGNAMGWWASSLDTLDEEEDEPSDDRQDILNSMARITMRLENKRAALRLLLAYHDGTSADERARLLAKAQTDVRLQHSSVAIDAASFESLCTLSHSSARNATSAASAGLRCVVLHISTHPMLILRPLRVEVLSEEPRIGLVYNFLSKLQTRAIRAMAAPSLYRALVFNAKREQTRSSNRISKVAWFRDHDVPMVARLSAAVSAVTGMHVESAEELQVVNYGVGGHYAPHADYTKEHEQPSAEEMQGGQRAATFLMYLSDVHRGGATVFPNLGLKVEAREGRALFWLNLLPNPSNGGRFQHNPTNRTRSKGDNRTTHGACPVLVGSKWIATKWIHELGQPRWPYDWPGPVR